MGEPAVLNSISVGQYIFSDSYIGEAGRGSLGRPFVFVSTFLYLPNLLKRAVARAKSIRDHLLPQPPSVAK